MIYYAPDYSIILQSPQWSVSRSWPVIWNLQATSKHATYCLTVCSRRPWITRSLSSRTESTSTSSLGRRSVWNRAHRCHIAPVRLRGRRSNCTETDRAISWYDGQYRRIHLAWDYPRCWMRSHVRHSDGFLGCVLSVIRTKIRHWKVAPSEPKNFRLVHLTPGINRNGTLLP